MVLSSRLTNECSVAIKKFSELEKITVTGGNNITGEFFEHCKKFTYLDIECWRGELALSAQTARELENIFENNGNTLRTLKLKDFSCMQLPKDTIFELIAKKLPKLEKLDISDAVRGSTLNLRHIDFRLINTLGLYRVNSNITLNPLLKALSDFGVIEDLAIDGGTFRDDTTERLTFKKLQRICVEPLGSSVALLKKITEAHMPELRNLSFYYSAATTSLLKY